jgi:hypothetical protein
MLTLRSTGLASPAYANWLDYVIVEAGRTVGRLYEDHHSPPEYRWFWSITVYVNPMLGITTNGRTATLAKLMNLVRHALGFGSNTWDRGSHPWPLRDRSADLRALRAHVTRRDDACRSRSAVRPPTRRTLLSPAVYHRNCLGTQKKN